MSTYKNQYGPLMPEEIQERRDAISLDMSTRQTSKVRNSTAADAPQLSPFTIALLLIGLAALAGLLVLINVAL